MTGGLSSYGKVRYCWIAQYLGLAWLLACHLFCRDNATVGCYMRPETSIFWYGPVRALLPAAIYPSSRHTYRLFVSWYEDRSRTCGTCHQYLPAEIVHGRLSFDERSSRATRKPHFPLPQRRFLRPIRRRETAFPAREKKEMYVVQM